MGERANWKEMGFETYKDYRKQYLKLWNSEKRKKKEENIEGVVS